MQKLIVPQKFLITLVVDVMATLASRNTSSGLTVVARRTAHVKAVKPNALLQYKIVFDKNKNLSVCHFHEDVVTTGSAT